MCTCKELSYGFALPGVKPVPKTQIFLEPFVQLSHSSQSLIYVILITGLQVTEDQLREVGELSGVLETADDFLSAEKK